MARFNDTVGKIVKMKALPEAKSTGGAARKAGALLKGGIIANAANPDSPEYLRGFWTRESDYGPVPPWQRILRPIVVQGQGCRERT